MKTRLLIALSVLTFTLFLNNQAKAQMKMSEIPDIVAKPAFEGSDAGIYVKVWIMSIIKDLGNIDVNNNNRDDDDINNTHNVLVEVVDEKGNPISNEVVKLLMITPSGKKASLDLDAKSDQYGGSAAFTETGEYQFTVSVSVTADSKPAQRTFNYKFYR